MHAFDSPSPAGKFIGSGSGAGAARRLLGALPKAAGAAVSKRRPVSDRSRKLKADQIARMEQLEREGRSETQVERRSSGPSR